MRFQNRANFEAMIDANMRLVGSIQPLFIVPTVLWPKSGRGARTFSDGDPAFCLATGEPATLKYFDAPHRPMYMQEYLIQSEIIVIPPRCFSILLKIGRDESLTQHRAGCN